MPSRPTDARGSRFRSIAEAVLAVTLVALGWTHGVLYVEGGSMEPALHAGDVIVYRRVGATLDQGDLVVFEHRGTLVVHRVAGVLRTGALRTRGDANDVMDAEPVPPDAIRGEVALTVPAGRVVAALAEAEQ
jgi:signal peptidase